MKILHLSHDGLPDVRVRRVARTSKKLGHTASFAGSFINDQSFHDLFEDFYLLPFNKYANAKTPLYWGQLKRKLSEVLNKYNPDLIHAHNIVAAKLASEYQIPFIYDDHEYASKQCQVYVRLWKPNKIYMHWLWSRWEKEVLQDAVATITVSKTIAEEHEKICNHVYVAPNFPSLSETKSLTLDFWDNSCLSSVYVGRDFSRSSKLRGTNRDVNGYLKIFSDKTVGTLTVLGDKNLPSYQNVKSMGFLPHSAMMNELTKHHIGLFPRKKHWYHYYTNPNKVYEYAHAGLLVLAISDLVNVKKNLGEYCVTYNNPNELKDLLLYYANNLNEIHDLRPKIRDFAMSNLTWEAVCEPQIRSAYLKL